ncbi:hypothetical protein [uncultured Prevotella sp.]|uniref:hypothetical protein n=1 Tax=uncultured Prevotella sp. TaxID=159272 RepID=UPI0025CBA678|nr:hypothetical protein [uncultured Prevotella sp.]
MTKDNLLYSIEIIFFSENKKASGNKYVNIPNSSEPNIVNNGVPEKCSLESKNMARKLHTKAKISNTQYKLFPIFFVSSFSDMPMEKIKKNMPIHTRNASNILFLNIGITPEQRNNAIKNTL